MIEGTTLMLRIVPPVVMSLCCHAVHGGDQIDWDKHLIDGVQLTGN